MAAILRLGVSLGHPEVPECCLHCAGMTVRDEPDASVEGHDHIIRPAAAPGRGDSCTARGTNVTIHQDAHLYARRPRLAVRF
jgi:hypothetical protein